VDDVLLGLSLGLGAGLAPGPLLALVVSATLDGGFPAGARIAVAPLLVDAPIVALCLLVLDALPEAALGWIAVAGGLYVAWLGWEAIARHRGAPAETAATGELRRGALVNALSPHPWLFWIGVGGPVVLHAGSAAAAAAFVVAFYALLVGTKLALAGLVARGRRRLLGTAGLSRALAASGGLLVAAGALLVIEGVGRLG
jgi:threonine/homoserine/homoserine lactone efflux protein